MYILCRQINPIHTVNEKINLVTKLCENEIIARSILAVSKLSKWEHWHRAPWSKPLLGIRPTMPVKSKMYAHPFCLLSASYGIEMYLPFFDNWGLSSSHSWISFFTPWEFSFLFYTENNMSTLCKIRNILKSTKKRKKMPPSSTGLCFWILVTPGWLIQVCTELVT